MNDLEVRSADPFSLAGKVSVVTGGKWLSSARQNSEVEGAIVNISSMAVQKPLTRVAGYSAAKAAVENFIRWLAVELAHKHGPGLRVNAIAPAAFSASRTVGCWCMRTEV